MNVLVIGSGYVGLVASACIAEFGSSVTCIDMGNDDIEAISQNRLSIYEPVLADYIRRNIDKGSLSFSSNYEQAISEANIIFITLPANAYEYDEEDDLQYLFDISKFIAPYLQNHTVVVDKIVIAVGAAKKVQEIINEENPGADINVASNPEFLRQGSAVGDFLRPERIILGVDSIKAEKTLRQIYRPLNLIEAPFYVTNFENAELIKLASNAFLATKVSFINEIANLCGKVGGDIRSVAKGMGIDTRIGSKFLHAGPGYGGPCFSKATKALINAAVKNNVSSQIISSTIKVNDLQSNLMAEKILRAVSSIGNNVVITILGLTFKPETDDMRDSPSLRIINKLAETSAVIRVHDPEGIDQAKKYLPDSVQYFDDLDSAIMNADALVLMTEWNQYCGLDLKQVESIMKGNIFVDLRNIYEKEIMLKYGFDYTCVG
ncbi:MAG: UDP-glucose/GDP-mannose dehydrogenase family protein [Pseudomonadota bacterium]